MRLNQAIVYYQFDSDHFQAIYLRNSIHVFRIHLPVARCRCTIHTAHTTRHTAYPIPVLAHSFSLSTRYVSVSRAHSAPAHICLCLPGDVDRCISWCSFVVKSCLNRCPPSCRFDFKSCALKSEQTTLVSVGICARWLRFKRNLCFVFVVHRL